MKNPVTFSVYEARAVQKKRQIRQIILLSAVILVLFAGIFFIYVLMMKDKIDQTFGTESVQNTTAFVPFTSETTMPETLAVVSTDPAEMTDTTASSEATTSADQSSGDASDPSGSEETTESVMPESVPAVDLFIPQSTALQSLSHKERDAAYHKLQQFIQERIDELADARISFSYRNLERNESFGYNDMEPFVPAGAFALPVNLCLYQMFAEGVSDPTELLPYESSDGTFDDSTIPKVAPYDLRTLSYLSLAKNDPIALNMLIRHQGGIDVLNDSLKTITDIVDFRTVFTYTDYAGKAMSGKNRTSAADLSGFMEEFYYSYMTAPDVFQPMFNDLAQSSSDWGVGVSYPTDVLLCHQTGSTAEYHCQTDVALVFAQEPFILAVSVECEDTDRAKRIQDELGALVYEYISSCYVPDSSFS